MLEQTASYLEKLGYMAEQQGSLEKYLVVFHQGQPLGFILSDGAVRMVSDAEGADSIQEILNFLKKNQGLESIGKGEFLLASYRENKPTTFYDPKDRMVHSRAFAVSGDRSTLE